jgi:hypothetical protein
MNLVLNNPADQVIEEAQVLQTDRKNFIETNTFRWN